MRIRSDDGKGSNHGPGPPMDGYKAFVFKNLSFESRYLFCVYDISSMLANYLHGVLYLLFLLFVRNLEKETKGKLEYTDAMALLNLYLALLEVIL